MCSQSGKDDWALRNTSPRTFLGQYSAWDCRSNNRNGRVRAPSSPLKRTNCIMTNGDYLVVRRPCTVCYAHHVLQQQDVSFSAFVRLNRGYLESRMLLRYNYTADVNIKVWNNDNNLCDGMRGWERGVCVCVCVFVCDSHKCLDNCDEPLSPSSSYNWGL